MLARLVSMSGDIYLSTITLVLTSSSLVGGGDGFVFSWPRVCSLVQLLSCLVQLRGYWGCLAAIFLASN